MSREISQDNTVLPPEQASSEPVTQRAELLAHELSKRYGSVVALRSASLTIRPAEIHALLGANGAGKSTLVKMLTGVIQPDGGQIEIQGHVMHIGSPSVAQRNGIAAVYQDPAL